MPRRRTPTAIKKLEGTERADRAVNEPQHRETRHAEPVVPLKSDAARVAWDYLVPRLESTRVLTEPDLLMLAQACNYHGYVEGVWANGEAPKAAEITQLRMLFTEFGLTPASRGNVSAGAVDTDDDFFDGPKLDK